MIAPMQPLRKRNRYPAAAILLGLALLMPAQPVLVSTYRDICSMRDTGHPAPTPAGSEIVVAPVEPGMYNDPDTDSKALSRSEHKLSARKSGYDAQPDEEIIAHPGSTDPGEPSPQSPPMEAKPAERSALPSRAQPAEQPPATPPARDHDTTLNSYVQQVISTYDGYYPYLLNSDYANYNGVSENLYFANRLLAKAHPSGNRATHCVGITFEVFFKAMQARNRKLGLDADDFNKMTFEELYDFMLIWYVAGGNKQVNNIEIAVEKYGLGKGIDRFEDARAGDFMDISRTNGTGHTVVFQDWSRNDNGQIIGVRYWSSQESGVGFNTEYFEISGQGIVCSNQVYIARVLPVHRFKSFR
ncbi:MAG: hypothetical protein ACOX30_09525 [Dethiobacteria bacterium]